jgi:hypothetical protein
MKRIMRSHRRWLARGASVWLAVVLVVSQFALVARADHEFQAVVPIDTVVRADEGAITQLTSPISVPSDAQGQDCDVTAHAQNQGSVHPDNDIIVESGSSQVVVPDVEAVSGGSVDGQGTLTLGSSIVISLRMGPDEVFSAGFDIVIRCLAEHQGRIIVVKQVTDGSDTSQSFDFTASYATDGFALSDGQSNDSVDLDPGTYSVSETVPADWSQVSAVCDDQSSVDAIDLQAGETVTCTFTNAETPAPPPEETGEIIVEKVVQGDGNQTLQFTFNTTGFTLADNTLAHGQSSSSGPVAVGAGYSVSEVVPSDWSQVGATCDDGSNPTDIDVSANEVVTCTFTNMAEPEVGASILVTVGQTCVTEGDEGHGVISVTVSVADGATVVVSDSDGGIVGTFSSDGSVTVPEGATYSWLATANDGFEFPAGFDSSGTVTIESCSIATVLPFTGIFADQLATLGFILLASGVLVMTGGWYLFGWNDES